AASITLSVASIGFTATYTYTDENGNGCTPRDAGTYTVELTIELKKPNYALEKATFTHEFVIKQAELTINWTNKGSYSSSEETNHPTAAIEGAVSGETLTVSYTYYRVDEGGSVLYGDGTTAPSEAGNYKVVVTLEYSGSGDNYTVAGSWEQSYTIVADGESGENNGN
ncbi:MAG: hypothetical protein LUD47_01335, partial [Clostridia bacterium]|nr:hypothetical protein [Clostridia bacterium]